MTNPNLSVFLWAALVLGGCGGAIDEGAPDEASQSPAVARATCPLRQSVNGQNLNGLRTNGLSQNKLAANGLSQNRLAVNGLSQNKLSANGLSQNKLAGNGLSQNRLAGNGLSQNRLAGNGLAQNRLAVNGLSQNRLSANGASLRSASLNGVRLESGLLVPEVGTPEDLVGAELAADDTVWRVDSLSFDLDVPEYRLSALDDDGEYQPLCDGGPVHLLPAE